MWKEGKEQLFIIYSIYEFVDMKIRLILQFVFKKEILKWQVYLSLSFVMKVVIGKK